MESDNDSRNFRTYRSCSNFRDIDLSGSTFDDVRLAASTFENVELSKSVFVDASLRGTHISNADLRDVEIAGAQETGMRIEGVLVTDLFRSIRVFESIVVRRRRGVTSGGSHPRYKSTKDGGRARQLARAAKTAVDAFLTNR